MIEKGKVFVYRSCSIIALGVIVSCSDDSGEEDKTGDIKNALKILTEEINSLGAKQLELQANILSKLGEEEQRIDIELQKLIGQEKEDNQGVSDMLSMLKKTKQELKAEEKVIVDEKIPLKIQALKDKRDNLIKDLFSIHYSGFLYYMKIDQPKAGVTPDQELAAKTILQQTIWDYIKLICESPLYLRSAEAYLDRNSFLAEASELSRLQYYYKVGIPLINPCLGVPAGAVITDDQYRAAYKLFSSHREAIICYLSIIYLTVTQAKLEQGSAEQRK